MVRGFGCDTLQDVMYPVCYVGWPRFCSACSLSGEGAIFAPVMRVRSNRFGPTHAALVVGNAYIRSMTLGLKSGLT